MMNVIVTLTSAAAKVLAQSLTEEARLEYRGFMNVSTENFRNGVLCGLLQRLRLWVNPRIVALTNKTEIDIKSLSQHLFSFYFAVPAEKEGIKAVAALVFNFIMNEVVLATDPKDMKHR
jgi:type IV secretory pathway TraG/TraD family ATPase VirD4